jgi:hypothetical protein
MILLSLFFSQLGSDGIPLLHTPAMMYFATSPKETVPSRGNVKLALVADTVMAPKLAVLLQDYMVAG